MKPSSNLLLLLLAAIVCGCGHTNNLPKYNVTGRSAIFRTHAAAGAARSYTAIQSPTSNTVGEVVAAVGSIIVSDQGRKKLDRAIVGDSISRSVSAGMEQATTDYLRLRPVAGMDQNPDFIVETELTKYQLISTTAGVAVRVSANTRMIDRKTGGLVWENDESYTVPISETYLSVAGGRAVQSGTSIFNAVQLLNLSDEELQKVIDEASVQVGREIGETLREDVAEMHKVD